MESYHCRKKLSKARPGYKPPNSHQIANKILENEFAAFQKEVNICLKGKKVCLAVDGWSNVHNDPIICIRVTEIRKGKVFLIDTINTNGRLHHTTLIS